MHLVYCLPLFTFVAFRLLTCTRTLSSSTQVPSEEGPKVYSKRKEVTPLESKSACILDKNSTEGYVAPASEGS